MKRIGVFFLVIILCAGLAWLAGWNFNSRTPWVAVCAAYAFFCAVLAAIYPGLGD